MSHTTRLSTTPGVSATCRVGLFDVPIVIRGPANGGTNVGATHSHTPENLLAATPGLKVVTPATAYDAKGLMKTAIRDNDPVMFMENTLLYGEKWEVPEEEYLIPLGLADVKRHGTDITLIAHGRAVLTCLKAAELLAAQHEINAEVVDLRSIRPLDEETILDFRPENPSSGGGRGKQTVLRGGRANCRDFAGKDL